MLRRRLGDDAFRAALRDLFDEHLERGVDTDDVRDAMRAHTGRSLDRLFAYYVEQPGLPHLAFQVGWSDDAGELTIGVSQGGAATPDAPATYRLDVPVLIQIGEEMQQRTLTVSDRQSVTRLPLPALPDVVAIDPHMSLLLAREDDRARLLWRRQLATGPTIFSRYLAARELAAGADHRTKELLAQAAADAGMATLVRRGAVQALAEIGDLQSHELLVDLAQQGLEPAPLRLELVERISRIAEDEVEELLALHAAADPNPHVAAAAAHFLGLRQARQYADLLRQILADAELAPRVRRAALGALARLDDGGTLPLVLELARPDAADVRTRAAAARVAGVLGYRQPEATFEMLVTRLEEPIPLVQAAALTGLAELGDERALQEVEYFRNATRDPLTRHAAQQSFAKLQARFADNRSEAQQRIDFLEQRIRELEAEVQRLRQELTAERRNDEN
jgi:aminopeptidase N